jgi:SAM-dependent methyltransferase
MKLPHLSDTRDPVQLIYNSRVKKLDQDVYEQNIEFWDRAWNGVKQPYTQMPDLPYIQEIPVKLGAGNVKRVLDLGCGSGWLTIFLGREKFDVVGVDLATHAIELGRQWAEQENLPVKFEVADISRLEYPDGSFDAVVANSIFEHLTYELADSTLQKLRKLLRPDGLFFGCFDKVGGGPGEYYELDDGTHVYTDKGRKGMLLRFFDDDELRGLMKDWKIDSLTTIESGSRIIWARR